LNVLLSIPFLNSFSVSTLNVRPIFPQLAHTGWATKFEGKRPLGRLSHSCKHLQVLNLILYKMV
jgi:hypothetical protein